MPRADVEAARATATAPAAAPANRRVALVATLVATALLAGGCSSMKFWDWSDDDDDKVSSAPPAPMAPVVVPPDSVDSVMAVIDGDPVTLRELDEYAAKNSPFLPADLRGDRRALLESLIEHRLLRSEFEKNGITATNEMVDRYIAQVIADSGQTRAQLEADVARAGVSWKEYYERMREEVCRIQLVNLLIRSHVNVPEEEVRQYWESDEAFVEEEKIEVGAIVLPLPSGPLEQAVAREKALEVRKEAVRNFEKAAREHSKGPGASEGGRLGDFKRGTMAPYLEEALEGLGKGEVSEPVEGAGAIWIVTLVDVKSAGRQPFEDVKEELADKLYDKRLAERYRVWATEGLRQDHRIEYLAPELAPPAATS